jgi:hypothetical protein
MNRAVFRTLAVAAIIVVFLPAIAGAYSVSDSTQQSGGVNLPQLPTSAFNINWTDFLNNLPVQSFLSSLESAGQNMLTQTSSPVGGMNFTMPAQGQNVIQQVDAWSTEHLGFRLSALFLAFLNVISWTLGVVKTIVDWLIGFLR